jgi:hypothetical protein
LGETLIRSTESQAGCIGYAEFLDKWDDPAFKKKLKPIIDFVDGLTPSCKYRWRRLELFSMELKGLRAECQRLLKIEVDDSSPGRSSERAARP